MNKGIQIWPLLGVLALTGCGTQVVPSAQSAPRPHLRLDPVIREGMAWIHHHTRLVLYAPTRLPRSARRHESGYGFANSSGYGMTLVANLPKALPFNSPSVSDGRLGKALTSYSVLKPTQAPGVSAESLLASYNLMGPAGLPPLEGTAVRVNGLITHWEARQGILWWKHRNWLFVVEGQSQSAAEQSAARLTPSKGLPAGPGLYVVTPGAIMADWDEKGLIATVSSQGTTPSAVLGVVESFRLVSPALLTQNG